MCVCVRGCEILLKSKKGSFRINVAASYRSHTEYTLTLSIYLDDRVDDNRLHQLYLHLQRSTFLFFNRVHKCTVTLNLQNTWGQQKQAINVTHLCCIVGF